MHYRDEIARRYGFETFAELLDISHSLPQMACEGCRSYLAQHPDGHWFIWEDRPLEKSAAAEMEHAHSG